MASTIVTLTLGAVDATYHLDALAPGAFIRAGDYGREMSGKGVNVSVALARGGTGTAAVVIVGEDDLGFLARSEHASLLRAVPMPGATRVNTSIIDARGQTTKVNAPAPSLSADTWHRAGQAALDAIADTSAGWLVISGTLPPVVGSRAPADVSALVHGARERGALVALDTSGEALSRAMSVPGGISLVKPNADELAALVGRSLRTLGEVRSAAQEVISSGITAVYASLGADGVLVVTTGTTVHAHATPIRLANTAGAGDASLAGFLVGLGARGLDDPSGVWDAAASAASWGAHAVAQHSTLLPDLNDLPQAVVVRNPDLSTPLREPAILAS